MIYLLEHVLTLLALGAAVYVSGRVLLPSPREGGDALAVLAAFVVGVAYVAGSAFLLAATGFLTGEGLLVAAALLAVAAAARRIPPRRLAPPRLRPWPTTASLAAFVVLLAVLLPFFALNVSPPVSWDAAVYHLTLPKLYVAAGGFRPVEMNVYSNWPLLVQLLYAVALLVHGYTLAKAVHFGFALLVLYAFFAACRSRRRPLPRTVPWLAAAFFLANGVVLYEIRTAYVDLAHAFLFFAAFLFMEKAARREGREAGHALLLAGLTCGLLTGVKVTGVLAVPVIAALYLPRFRLAEARGFLLRFALPAAALWTPWLVKSAVYTGNPVYPFLHSRLGGPDWNVELGAHFEAWQRGIGMGRGVLDYLLLAPRVVLQGKRGYTHFDGEIGTFWIVLVPLALYGACRSGTVRRALGVAGLYFAVWAATSQQTRFLIPILPLLALAGAVTVAELVERLPAWRRTGHGLALAAALGLVVLPAAPLLGAGARTLVVLSRAGDELAASVVPPHLRFVNEHLPQDARLLFVQTNLGFFCDREYLADSFFEASQVAGYLAGAASADEVEQRLRRRGITHVLVDRRPLPLRPALPDALGPMLAQRTLVLHRGEDGRFEVRKLR